MSNEKKTATGLETKQDNVGNQIETTMVKHQGSTLKKSNTAYKNKRPGRLAGEVALSLHTVDAQKLFIGFKAGKTPNLIQFGGRMTQIWDAAELDDPYADYTLLRVYDQIVKLRKELAADISHYKAQLEAADNDVSLTFSAFASQKPVIESLWFRTQYGYLAARLVASFDELMRTLLTAHRIGVLLDKPYGGIRQEWIDKLLALFRFPYQWQSFDLTRSDIKAQNEKSKAALEKLGELPKAVLSSELRSPFAPRIKQHLVQQKKQEKLKDDAIQAAVTEEPKAKVKKAKKEEVEKITEEEQSN